MRKLLTCLLTFTITVLLSCPPVFATKGDGRKVVATAATAERLVSTTTPVLQASICAESDNTGQIAVGSSTVVAALATRRGIYLDAGDCYNPCPSMALIRGTCDLYDVWLDTTVNGDGVTFDWVR